MQFSKLVPADVRRRTIWNFRCASPPSERGSKQPYAAFVASCSVPGSHAALLLALFFLPFLAHSQTNSPSTTNDAVRAEQTRTACVSGRRLICGRVLKVFPEGLVVESGYTNLVRKSLEGAWLMPGTVVASRAPNLVETQEPDSPCVGTVFLTDLPRPRGGGKVTVKSYDYVVLRGYPAGTYTYSTVGGIERTVRRFSVGLETAVKLSLHPPKKVPGD
jgi:hypothetical protein